MSSASSQFSENPVLILLHGATANGRMWDPVRRALAGKYRILTPDLPGHGSLRGERFTLERAIEVVAAAAASVAPAPVVIAGDSLGGYVSMASAAAVPATQLRGLVLSGCTLVFEGSALWPFRFKAFFHKLLLGTLGEKRLVGERFVRELGKLGVEERDARALMADGVNIGAFGDCVKALTGIDFPAKVAAIRQPVIFVNGGNDKQMLRDLERYRAAAPGARHRVFPGLEHGVSMRSSAEFAELVDRFAHQPV